jgi:hypothetical protein
VIAESQTSALLSERATIDHLGAGLGKRTFANVWEFLVEFARQDELKDSVTEEFEALIVLNGGALLVRNGRMRQRQSQQIRIAESVTQAGLEFLDSWHGFLRSLQVQAR